MKIVKVVWNDSQSTAGDWLDKNQFESWAKEPLILCESVGFLTHEEKEHIVLTQTLFDEGMTECIKIPTVNIVETRVLNE